MIQLATEISNLRHSVNGVCEHMKDMGDDIDTLHLDVDGLTGAVGGLGDSVDDLIRILPTGGN